MKDPDDLHDEPLSDDPEENLRMENELLRLKMKAELGAESNIVSDLGPEMENFFLKNVLQFEHSYANSKRVKLFDLLGQPEVKKPEELNDDMLILALQQVTDLLEEHSIAVDFDDEIDDRTRYTFIVEELFDQEADDFKIPGMTTHFDYEEFHPNNKNDIESRTREFLAQWFNRSLDERSWQLADTFVLPDRRTMSRAEVAAKMKQIFDAFNEFTDTEYVIDEIKFELQDHSGLGHAEGSVKYKGVLDDGGVINFAGPFKFYMSMEDNWWSIFHIVFPGFRY